MIYSLAGKIIHKDNKSLIMENQGIGYKIFCSPNTLKNISEGQEARIFTYLFLREDAAELYGFLTKEELELFETLNSISGIGPKTALLLASLGSLEKLKEMMESSKLPSEIKGIGQKRTQKILLELTGKIKELKKPEEGDFSDGSLDALIYLGFPKQKAKEALGKVSIGLNKEEKIKEALKIISRH